MKDFVEGQDDRIDDLSSEEESSVQDGDRLSEPTESLARYNREGHKHVTGE